MSVTELDGINRLACPAQDCSYIHRGSPVPVVAMLVRYDDRYIIAHNSDWPHGIFSVITGYLERGESPEQAAVREVAEELGLSARITRFIGHYIFKERNQLILGYELAATGTLRLNHELFEVKQLLSDELRVYDFSPLYITEQIISDWAKLNELPNSQ